MIIKNEFERNKFKKYEFILSILVLNSNNQLFFKKRLSNYIISLYLCGPFRKSSLDMSILEHFSVPYIGIKDGLHQYRFKADSRFFAMFDNSPIIDGDFDIIANINKRSGLSELDFEIDGYASALCDRCLVDIRLPISSRNHMLVKVSNKISEDDEVIFIREDHSHLDLSQIIYEFIVLAMPLMNIYDCENEEPRKCDMSVLKKLSEDVIEDTEPTINKIWEYLKDINLDN